MSTLTLNHARPLLTQSLPLSILQFKTEIEDKDEYIENTMSMNEHTLNTGSRKGQSSKKITALWSNVTGGLYKDNKDGCLYFAFYLEKLVD